MSFLPFTTEEDGIHNAEWALDELRKFVRVPPVGLGNIDKKVALRTQLENLEEMMRVITDARFARSLIKNKKERALVTQRGHQASLEMLRFIVITTRDVLASQTYDDDTQSLNGIGSLPGTWPSR